MKVNLFATPEKVETFCPSCNSFYFDFVGKVNVNNEKDGNKFYFATCSQCLKARQDFEIYLAWQKLIFVNKTVSFNLSPVYKFYN